MNKKRVLRFIKRFFLGLIFFYSLILVVLFIFNIKYDQLNTETEIPKLTMENQFGELKSFSDYKGKLLLVDFWFQGCKPCLEEMKFFPELLKKYDSKLAIMSISIDPKEWTKFILKNKPKPWDFLLSNNKNWTFYNDNRKEESIVKELKIIEYPTYLLFDKNGDLISSPNSGIAAVEYELSGIFGLDLTLKTDRNKKVVKTLPFLIIHYSILVVLILIIQLIIFGIKKLIGTKKTNANKGYNPLLKP